MSEEKKNRKTKSYSYILPMLMHAVPGLKTSQGQLENVFIADENYPYLDSHIFLLYEFTGEMWFLEFEEMARTSSLHELTEDKDKLHVMMVFRVPEEYQESYKMFKKSQYSKMSEDYKVAIQKFHALHQDHAILDVLYRREKAYTSLEKKLNTKVPRDQEASSVINWEKETYSENMKVPDPMKMNWDLKT